ncbi:MAG: hypothetical protein J6X42_01160 [Alphaproteobacteria bacterium]|nr:hypothetical protein [Alphaproteobacteria bacterium]
MSQKNNKMPEAQGAGRQIDADIVKAAWMLLERHSYRDIPITPDEIETVKALFLPSASDKEKAEAYQTMMEPYEILISYAWKMPELHDDAFRFWDAILKDEKSLFSGNSIIRILGDRPNEDLVTIFKHHRKKFTADPVIRNLLYVSVDQRLAEGPFDFKTRTCGAWSDRERKLWIDILNLLK